LAIAVRAIAMNALSLESELELIMKYLLILSIVIVQQVVLAQKITISGKIVDKETKEALVFASVGLKGKPIGTITNLQGEFDFHIPAEYRNEIFSIAMLGYKNFEAPVWTLLEISPLVIEAERSSQVLNEVVVSDSLLGGDIMRIALSRIEQNYPMEPYLMDGFYRDIKKVGGTYISVLEAAIKIYDENFKAPRNKFKLRERVALLEVRRSLGYGNKFTTYFDEDNLLEDLLLHNNIRYRQFPEEEVFFASLGREEDSFYNGHSIFVVKHKSDYNLMIYIDKETFGIIHLDYEDNQVKDIGKRKGLVSKFVSLKRVIDFKLFEGKMYLNYISVNSGINWYDARTEELKFETELNQQLLINQVYPNTDERIGTTEKMRSYGLQFQDLPYNKEFWNNYNVIKESPLDKKIIDDLEKEVPLETQFEDN